MSQPMPSPNPSILLKPQASPIFPSSFLTRMMGSVALLNLFVITLAVLSIHQSYLQYQERAEIITQNLTQTLESEIAGAIKTDDIALFAVLEEYKKQRAVGINEKAMNAYIERVRSRLPEIDALRITDAQGVLIYGSDVIPGAKVSLADRPHFIRPRDDPKAGLVISKPLVSRANKKWVVVLARRIDQPDGSFGGIVFAAITLEQLSRMFSALNIGPHGVVTLRDNELSIVVRYPEAEGIGSVIGQKTAALSLQEMVRAGQKSGTYQTRSSIDGFERMFSYRRVDNYPFIISVGLATEDYLAAWRRETAEQAALIALFSLITFLAAWLIYRFWKRKVNLVEALARQEDRFRTVADYTFHWEYWKGPNGEILYMTPSCERVTGYIRELFISDPSLLLSIVHPEDRHVLDQHLHDITCQAYQDGTSVDFRIVRRNGEVRWISHNCRIISGQNGEDLGRRVSNRDITERKQVEQALVESEERFNLFMDTLPAAVFIKNEEGIYIYVNRYLVDNFGEHEWVGKADRDIFPPEVVEKIHADDQRVLETGLVVADEQIPGAEGDVKLLEARKFRIPRRGLSPFIGGIVLDFTEQRRNAEQYRSVVQASLDGYWVTDNLGRILEVNDAICRMHGYSREELLRLSISDIEADETPEETAAHIREMIEKGHVQFEARHKRKDGSIANVEVSILHVNTMGDRFFAFIRDVTERKQVEAELRIAATAFESQEGMVITDADNVILRVNRAYTEITGYTAEEAVGRRSNLLKSGRHDAAFYAGMWETLRHQGAWQGEIWNRRKNGEVYPEWLTITAVKGIAGEVTHYVGTLTDITLRKAAENEIKHLAFYDPLTRLPNRRLLLDRLQQALASSTRKKSEGALLFIDLDNFKTLNDTLGHDIGDILLQQVAQRLATCIREGDTVARLGGDEFVVMLEDLSENPQESATQTETVCEKILAMLNQPYQLADHLHHSTPSIGATLFNGHQNSVDELLKRADLAMYQAKAAGRNTVRFYDPEMQAAVTAHASMEADLRQGLQQNEFLLYYQPQVNEKGWRTGAEALVRWQHPRRGLMLPADFIPITEETGLILPLGHWVLKTACAQLVAWAAQPEMTHLTLAVNVSARQFHRRDFVAQVLEVLDQTGADPQKLKLELTESLLLEDVEDIIAKMTALKAKGVCFSLDDFGTGYSSLSYLKRLPLDQLKIDQSFVRDILTDSNDAAIARTIVALAQSMGLEVIAEGVETVEQRDFLASQSCHAFQGYLFGRPLPIENFAHSIRS